MDTSSVPLVSGLEEFHCNPGIRDVGGKEVLEIKNTLFFSSQTVAPVLAGGEGPCG